MLDYQPTNEDGYAVLTISGRITEDDFDRIVPLVEEDIQARGKLRLLEKIESFTGMDPMAFVRDVQFGLPLVNKITHVAVVAEPAWMRVSTDLFGSLFPGKVKSFEPETEEAARIWLKSVS